MRSRSFMLFFVLCVSVSCVFGYNWSDNPGDGSEGNPYQISTPNHLIAINDLDTTGVYFVMTNDIDLSGQTYTNAVIASFSGVFDGNSLVIHNLTGGSLIGEIEGIDAVVKNLGVENISSNSGGGGLARVLSYGLIKNCYTTGTIQGTSYIGGLVGQSFNNGTITDCHNQCNVSGFGDTVWQVCYIGGLVGWQTSGQIIRCYNEGTISGGNEVGGLVGSQQGEIHQSYNLGNVIGFDEGYGVGGIAGFQYSGPVKDCYNSGTVEGYSYVGGITGRGGFIQNSYNLGLVSGDQQIGGLSGYDIGSINSVWNLDTAGITGTAPRSGRTSEQMKQAATYIGWNDDGPVWVLDEGTDYPRLAWEGTTGVPLPTHSLSEFFPPDTTGTEWDPYRIYTAEQLNAIGLFPEEWNKYFSLENDIDAAALTQFRRIGTGMIPFTGVFEGNGFAISNFTYSTTENEWCIGLFGLAQDAVIQNLSLENVNIFSNDTGAGSIVGAMMSGILENCSSTGTVSGEDYVGGLICAGSATITNCHSTCTVSGKSIVGGFIGNASGTISHCYSTGQVIGNGTQNEGLGGFAGQQLDGTIEFCYSTGNIYGKSKVGGFVGIQDRGENFYPYENSDLVIQNCYSWGNVLTDENSRYVGGFLGYQHTRWVAVENHNWTRYDYITYVFNCYSVGQVMAGTGSSDVGGFVGYSHDGTMTDSYWDMDASGLSDGVSNVDPDPAGVMGKTTEQMQNYTTYIGWDFSAVNYDTADWHPPTTDYPHLAWEPYHLGPGSGTPEDPWRLYRHQQMNAIGLNSDLWDKHFMLMNDIDMSVYTEKQYNTIGSNPWIFPGTIAFTGSFDGNGHVIRNLTCINDGPVDYYYSYMGLFGCIQAGTVKNLGIANVSMSIGEFFFNAVGGLAGWNAGTISNCFVTGSVNGISAGGLVGVNEGEVINCYMSGSVSGPSGVGGMVGDNYGSFTNCYAAASVNASEFGDFGGFAGWNNGTFLDCFWNVDLCETAGSGDLNGVAGKTTFEMLTRSTFPNWDYVGDDNGNQDIWRMCTNGVDFPRLSWEFSRGGDFVCPDGVGVEDLAALADNWLASSQTQPETFNYACDANMDGAINLLDYAVLAANWLVD